VRVLHINKFGWPKGGSDVYMLRACERLAELPGVDVGLWAANPQPEGAVLSYEARIPEFHEVRGARAKVGAALNVLWSKRAARDLDEVISAFRPDVVHLHLYAHQFSSSIVRQLRDRRVATVATAHDYKLACPAYLAVRKGDDCFKCAHRISPSLVSDACLHGDRMWSSVAMAEAVLVRRLRLVPSVVIAPSRFMHDRLVDSWIAPLAEVRMIRNPAEPSGAEWVGGGDYLLFVGRLVAEKGIDELIRAIKALQKPLRLVVAGDGPEREHLEAVAGHDGKVEFVGHVGQEQLFKLRRGCIAQVLPSAWPENAPLAALEAAVDGVPLIATERGGLSELFEIGARGALLRERTPDSWSTALDQLVDDTPLDVERLAQFREAVAWDGHLKELTSTYEHAIAQIGGTERAYGEHLEPLHARLEA
jgi:glycosyltransferase involved in cell wall biosynthesis